MKKNVLALSITAALVGLGSAGGAQAAAANQLQLSADGIGHMAIVPYYTAQGSNATLINITNTDTINGKAVKVRFRGAANSDDVYDFQVFLSPSDMWTASVTKGTDGRATLTTADNSCTKPTKAVLNSNGFVISRVDPKPAVGDVPNQTREGYVEMFVMADIVPGTSLFSAIVHATATSTPTCTGAAWTALDTYSAQGWTGLTNPTSGLMGNWVIINTADAGAWSGAATAIAATTDGLQYGWGNNVYSPQTATPALVAMGLATMNAYTADPLFRGAAPIIAAGLYDLPDMSTPYVSGGVFTDATAVLQSSKLSFSLATRNVINEYLTASALNATTDWTLTSVTRRYSVALNYTSGAPVYTSLLPNREFYSAANVLVSGRQICVTNVTPKGWDQEENSPTNPTDVVISPSTPASPLIFCGEANVLAINNAGVSGTLGATVARSAFDNSFKAGWINITTPGLGNGLPLQGSAFIRATAPTGRYGVTWDHRWNRPDYAF